MIIDNIPAGKDVPNDINVIIEIPMNHDPIKYEMDKDSGAIFVDRFMQTSMSYPANYGFVPHTLSEDGDPIDVLVISHWPIMPGAVIRSRPIGVLLMEDESGKDEKAAQIYKYISSNQFAQKIQGAISRDTHQKRSDGRFGRDRRRDFGCDAGHAEPPH